MDSSAQIMWGMLFGAIGLGFFIYGQRQRAIIPFVVGVALFVFPYIISNVYLLVFVGVVLVAIPYFIRI